MNDPDETTPPPPPSNLPPTTPPPPEDPLILALSGISGKLAELHAMFVAQGERTEKFMEIAERCFDQCLVAQHASEEVAKVMRDHEHRIQKLEGRATILPPPNGGHHDG